MKIRKDWKPTAKNVNNLPDPIREYIFQLETNADPAGMVAQNIFLKDQVEGLSLCVGNLAEHLHDAELNAWKALSSYKFIMFGYHAAIWVHLNRVGNFNKPNPFRDAVELGRSKITWHAIAHLDKIEADDEVS